MSKEENDAHGPLLYSFKFVGEVHGEAVIKDRTHETTNLLLVGHELNLKH